MNNLSGLSFVVLVGVLTFEIPHYPECKIEFFKFHVVSREVSFTKPTLFC